MHARSITCCDLYVQTNVRSYCMLGDALQTDIPPSPLLFSSLFPTHSRKDAGLVDSVEQLEGPRQKKVQQENPILSKASPNINCTPYSRIAQSPKMKGLPPEQPKFSSFLPQPTTRGRVYQGAQDRRATPDRVKPERPVWRRARTIRVGLAAFTHPTNSNRIGTRIGTRFGTRIDIENQ
ncbi:hypothetical protein LI328DRAFT_160955 [Trichoderma asperelloides]|nr:hypothetical protein LI328DRAFT_160955 [Trichoderma asperelloides]